MSEPCDICRTQPWCRIKFGKFICIDCEPPWDGGVPSHYEVVTLRPSPGVKEKIRKSEINEIKRHRMLPYKKKGGGYYAGRLSDSGKIDERPLKT